MYDGAMLKEVYCELFKSTAGPRGRIQFHQGLNTVLGGEAADNSIGKSTFLLILDYCFGGETYGKANVKNYVGDHTICFAFHFKDGDHYYSRTVSDSKHVNRCNSEYQPVGDPIDLKAFRQELFDGYEIALEDITFRDMVGRFFRISGKGNDEIENPLHYKSPKGEQAVEAFGDTNTDVAVYVKLPDGFYISTPVGHYNPDWAIAFYEGSVKHIYFVAETKGSMNSMQLRLIEESKIHCAREHFKAISNGNVVYDVVDSYTSLMEKVMK